jgi:hypothetical protein
VDRSYLAYKDPVAGYVPIPPTQLVDRSYLAYGRKRPGFPNLTNCIGGARFTGFPTCDARCRLSMNNPPTALVGLGKAVLPSTSRCRLSMNDPPTALVGFGLFAQPLPWVGFARVARPRFNHTPFPNFQMNKRCHNQRSMLELVKL